MPRRQTDKNLRLGENKIEIRITQQALVMRQELKECGLRAHELQGRVMHLQDRVHLNQGRHTADSRPS